MTPMSEVVEPPKRCCLSNQIESLVLHSLYVVVAGYEVHIVYMGDLPEGDDSLQATHYNILHDILGSHSLAQEALVYSYQRSLNGFVAKLANAEVVKLRATKGVVSVFPNRKLQIQTTRSWDFLGVPRSQPIKPTDGSVIVGMLDTGIWPESKSFEDESFGAPPSKWKGTCQSNNFTCNNVQPVPYDQDSISIGSFHAMKNGILTSCAAGNSGPIRKQVSNYFPWALTVAASTIDRKFVTKVVLGDGQTFFGTSLNGFTPNATAFPLVYSGDANNVTFGAGPEQSKMCLWGTLSNKAEGGIVLCDYANDGGTARLAKAAGIIMPFSYLEIAFSFPAPAVFISHEDHDKLFDYIRTTEIPIATILHTEAFEDSMAPLVTKFSSRGPNPISPEILKPDITAPGANILAAWSPLGLFSVYRFDKRSVDYNIVSGTSMSCPHATGAAAYVKASHPDWSPAAIKSALMTTATIMDSRKNPDAEFAYGSGQIDPMKAVDPGLVFDASEADYINFLCGEGYNISTIRLISGDASNCSTASKTWDLNYPSFALSLLDGEEKVLELQQGQNYMSILEPLPMTRTTVRSKYSKYRA
uniref:Inhibitor I9 domain-containing protein n=1 Tax=Daucus carota subsp. sativus TaxID=79200 RepID=A0A162A3Y3_DAUCS